jgi:hypothetical protein
MRWSDIPVPAVGNDATTRYAGLTRTRALIVLACTAAFLTWSVAAIHGRKLEVTSSNPEYTDLGMYHRVVERLRSGESYYAALGAELRQGHYASRSVFNWRTPAHLTIIGLLSEPVSHVVLAALVFTAIIMACISTRHAGGPEGIQLLFTALAECFLLDPSSDIHLVAEVWAGILILISVAAYSFRRWPIAVGAGVAALFFRELALPYACIGLLFAIKRRHKPEILAWSAGLCAWTIYFLAHAQAAIAHMNPRDIALHVSWIQFAGPRFLVETVRMSVLIVLPNWVSAICLSVALLGIGGWKTGIGPLVGAVVAAYMAAFSVVGLPVDLAWGAITNPLLAFGMAWSLPAIRDLLRAVAPKPEPIVAR